MTDATLMTRIARLRRKLNDAQAEYASIASEAEDDAISEGLLEGNLRLVEAVEELTIATHQL